MPSTLLRRGIVATFVLWVAACALSDNPTSDAAIDTALEADTVLPGDARLHRDVASDSRADTLRDVLPDGLELDAGFTTGEVFGRTGGWLRSGEGQLVLSGFLCGLGANTHPRLRILASAAELRSHATRLPDARWLEDIRPLVSATCADNLVEFQLLLLDTPEAPSSLSVQALSDSGWTTLDATGRAPQWPTRPLEGTLILNHDGYAHYLVPEAATPVLPSPWRPGAPTSSLGLSAIRVQALFDATFATSFAADVDGLAISLMYGQNPMWQSERLPFAAHQTYWTARDPLCRNRPERCFSDNLLNLLAEGTSLAETYAHAQSDTSLTIASFRVNDNHHILPGGLSLADDSRGSSRLVAGTPPFVQDHAPGDSVPRCVVSLGLPAVRALKLELVEELLVTELGAPLDVLELDLTRRFCVDPSGTETAWRSFLDSAVLARDRLSPRTSIWVRLPRDRTDVELHAQGVYLSTLSEWNIDGVILGRDRTARLDPRFDSGSLLTAIRDFDGAVLFDLFQLDRSVEHTESDLSPRALEIPSTFARLVGEQSSAFARGATAVSFFNFQYYPLRFTAPVSGGFARVEPPYNWLGCLKRRACVDVVSRLYAGRLTTTNSWVVDYHRPIQGSRSVRLVVHPNHRIVATAEGQRRWMGASFAVLNERTEEHSLLAAGLSPATPPPLRLPLAAPYSDYMTGDPNAKSVLVAEPENGAQRFRFECGANCDLIGDVEILAVADQLQP